MLEQLLRSPNSSGRTVDAVRHADSAPSGRGFAEQLAGEQRRSQNPRGTTSSSAHHATRQDSVHKPSAGGREVGKVLPQSRGEVSPGAPDAVSATGSHEIPVNASIHGESARQDPVALLRDKLSKHLEESEVEKVLDLLADNELDSPLVALDEGQWLGVSEEGGALLLTLDSDSASQGAVTVTELTLDELLAGLEDNTQMTLGSAALADYSPDDWQSATDILQSLTDQLAKLKQQEPESLQAWQVQWLEADPVLLPEGLDSEQLAAWLPESLLNAWLESRANQNSSAEALTHQYIKERANAAMSDRDFSATDVSEELAVALGLLDGDSDDTESELKLAEEEAPRRSRAATTESLLSRLIGENARDATKTVAGEDSSLLRQPMEQTSPRELNRQAVLELAKSHVERQLQVKNSAGELTQQLSERLVVMIGQDIQEARIRLDPPELGRMDVKVTTQNDQVQVQVIAQQPMVRDLLEQHANRLREMLEQQGFTQVDVDVSDQAWGDDDADQAAAGNGGNGDGDDDSDADETPLAESRPLGLIDQYV